MEGGLTHIITQERCSIGHNSTFKALRSRVWVEVGDFSLKPGYIAFSINNSHGPSDPTLEQATRATKAPTRVERVAQGASQNGRGAFGLLACVRGNSHLYSGIRGRGRGLSISHKRRLSHRNLRFNALTCSSPLQVVDRSRCSRENKL